MNRRPAPLSPRRTFRVLAAATCALALGAGPTAYAASTADPAPGTIGGAPSGTADTATITWGIGPTPEGPEPGTPRPSFFLDAEPGEEIRESLRLRNLSETPIELKLYTTDAINTLSGQQDLLPASEQPKDIGTWFTLEQDEVKLDKLQYIDIPFTLDIPDDAEPGDHTGGIVSGAVLPGVDANGSAVNVDQRLASRVALRVDGPLSPALTISDYSAGYKGTWNPAGRGSTDLRYRLTNTGNVRLSADQIVKAKGPLGLVARTATLNPIPELLPGSSIVVTSSLSGVWPTLRSSAGLEIRPIPTRPGDEFPALKSARASAGGWAVPWSFLLLMLVVGITTGLALKGKVQLKLREQKRIDAAVAEKLRETAPALATPPSDSLGNL